jgi:hypothetical protein
LYLCVSSFGVDSQNPGVYKSVDAGTTWTRVGLLDEPIHVRVNASDPQHLVAADGVRGATQGFWRSFDGGETWEQPEGFVALQDTLYAVDAYDVATDPTDFDHVLLTSHSPWDGWNNQWNNQWNGDSGILESMDGGDTWVLNQPVPGWGVGNGVWFLDNDNTWLFGSQGNGFWRRPDGGEWTQVMMNNNMQHGGGGIYRSPSGVIWAGGTPQLMRSDDNGVTWTLHGPSAGFNHVIGDGTNLYTAPVFGPRFLMSSEEDGETWTDYPDGPELASGPFELAFDPHNRIVYSGSWSAGLWALKVD